MMMIPRCASTRAFIAGLALLGGGCAAPPEAVPVTDPRAAWDARQQRLAGLREWTAIGRLALRSERDAWDVSLRWAQVRDSYRIRLSAAFGQGLVELQGERGRVEMRTADGTTAVAQTPDALLMQQVGWSVPVGGLRYWLLGLAQPGVTVAHLELDAAGRLQALEQSGWRIRYLDYRRIEGEDLPAKVFMQNGLLSAKVLVRRWRLTAG